MEENGARTRSAAVITFTNSDRGSALTVTLAAMALLIPLGALAVLQARSSLLLQQNLRGHVEALYAAEAGLEWATAALPPDMDAALAAAGPDRVPGTADDGVFPFGTPPAIADPPLLFDLRLDSPAAGVVRLAAIGYGSREAERTLERLLVRSAAANAPAAVYTESSAAPVFGVAAFVVSGHDHLSTDPIGSPTGSATALPALAYASAADAATAAAQVAADDVSRLQGVGGPPSIGHDRALDLDALIERAEGEVAARRYASGNVPSDLTAGEASGPQLTIIEADAEVSGTWSGGGILIVRGLLHVTGQLDFSGLVLATGGLRLDSAGAARIHGGLWLAEGPLEMRGAGGIAACRACVTAADDASPGILPHRYLARAWRELLP